MPRLSSGRVYYENVIVDKSVKIMGISPLWTIVDGSKATDQFGSVFAIGRGVTATLPSKGSLSLYGHNKASLICKKPLSSA